MLFIMRGTSCSGKDKFIDEHFKNRSHVLSSDVFREMCLGDIRSQQHNARVFSMMYEILEMRFQNRVNWTVLNATNLRFKDVSVPVELCKKYKVPFTFMSIIPPDIETLKKRNEFRAMQGGLDVPEEVFERHHNRYTASIDPFIREATYSELCQFIEMDQKWEVVRHVSGRS